jgi:hypothetical protein
METEKTLNEVGKYNIQCFPFPLIVKYLIFVSYVLCIKQLFEKQRKERKKNEKWQNRKFLFMEESR